MHDDGPLDKREINWKLTLHQIGWFLYIAFSCFFFCPYLAHAVKMILCVNVISSLIFMPGLDVVRTDRTLMFYEKQENLAKLWDILSVYSWFDADVGYCQGELRCWLYLLLLFIYLLHLCVGCYLSFPLPSVKSPSC